MVKKKEKKKTKKQDNMLTRPLVGLIVLAALVMFLNQLQINGISTMLTTPSSRLSGSGNVDLEGIDLSQIKSTGHTLAAVFPVEEIQTVDDAMAMIFPTGTPEYGEALGVSYDDPVGSLSTLAKMYRGLKAEVEKSDPEAFQRFVNLASNPYGISCEYCCGVGPIGADKNGNSRCGCQHNPAALSLALYLAAYTDYNDGEILREVMKWKTLFFPKNMIELAMTVAGGDTSALDNLPGMVGGC
ncbi:MAG: hypothetical protein ISS25_00075 [Nanoarchaeota archaeon]|nr:hypothetical protein [DPANN group archaeon]MBL7116215.1 hypothetical protein [Nanoarchaeota archaeon]